MVSLSVTSHESRLVATRMLIMKTMHALNAHEFVFPTNIMIILVVLTFKQPLPA